MQRPNFLYLIGAAALGGLVTQVLLAGAQSLPASYQNAILAPQALSTASPASDDPIFDYLWKKTFQYQTFFENLQGFTTKGNVDLQSGALALSAGGNFGAAAEILKQPMFQGLATFSERSRFRTAFTVTSPSGTIAYVSVGLHGGAGYGFKVVDDTLYGFTNDGTKENTIFLQTVQSGKIYSVEGRYKPNDVVAFYVNTELKGAITDVLPKATKTVNPTLFDLYLESRDGSEKTLQTSFFEYLQKRSVLK